jgi:hypothetical protein
MPDAIELRNHIIRHEDLRDAIKYVLSNNNGPVDDDRKEVADGLSIYLLNFFGYGDRIIDNMLSPDDRDQFYMCEEDGLLKTEQEEETLITGRVWRIHYWILKKETILKYAHVYNNPTEPSEEGVMEDLYKNVGDDAWQRNGTEAHT